MAGLHGQLVHQVVHRVARVALDPTEGDISSQLHQVDEGFPEIAVGHGLLAELIQPRARQPVHEEFWKQFTP
jgi:hypothetical protein